MTASFQGYTAILLHAHLPYVKQLQDPLTLEERWYYEAVTDTYLPLIDMFDRLVAEGIPLRLTLSLSPTLLAMMEDRLMQQRARQHLKSLYELAQKEVIRLWGDAEYFDTARHYVASWKRLLELYDRLNGDLITKLRSLYEQGCLELIPCAATHAFLPLVKNAEALRTQLEAAVTEFRRHFGRTPAGIWLPECGYTPAVEPHLQALGLRYFVVAAHTVGQAQTTQAKARPGVPLLTRSGAAAFARDPEASTQVWSAEAGYPSDPDYREYYRDIGFDLGRDCEAEWAYIKPYVLPTGERIHTGLKYHRVTGATDAKEPYHPQRAAQKAQLHAEHFLAARVSQLSSLSAQAAPISDSSLFSLEYQVPVSSLPAQTHLISVPSSPIQVLHKDSTPSQKTPAPPVIVCPYDAELFGHWWYEGPIWLEEVLRGLDPNNPNHTAHSITLSEYLDLYPPLDQAELPESSWGRDGYADVWLQPRTDWIYPRLHEAEDTIIRMARQYPNATALTQVQQRMLNQAARELLLAQSSDWAFILDTGTVTSYAEHKISQHLEQFHTLISLFNTSLTSQPLPAYHDSSLLLLSELERRSRILPQLSYTSYSPDVSNSCSAVQKKHMLTDEITLCTARTKNLILPRQRVLMLAWEYPPRVIGGLAHAVYHLSRHLALAGLEIHVITCYAPEAPPYEIIDNVHIHRVPILQSLTPVHFLDWVFQMNLAFIDYGLKLTEQGHHFDLIHAHDWLVYYCATALREEWNTPLVATIHATESGRNLGVLDTQLQQSIHQIESKLVQEADRIITCSHSMSLEVQHLFALSEAKVSIIPNGIEACSVHNSDSSTASPSLQRAIRNSEADRIIGFIGRLVHEKGIHILIQAMSLVLPSYPTAKLLIAGTGPMLDQLIELASPLGDRIQFIGFLGEPDKSIFLQHAELCVFPSLYEPFGIVALEAMISETPIIVSNVGGLGEIVEPNWDGYQVPAGDVAAVAQQILFVLTHPSQGRIAAKHALVKAQTHYNWATISTLTAQTYEALA